MYNFYMIKRRQQTSYKTNLSLRRQRELSKAVKKTVKQYHVTLKLLAKT
jgi:hypothetical protein